MTDKTVYNVTLLQIAQLGNRVLRDETNIVEHIKNKEIQKLIDDMIVTCLDVDGVGIAAPQVYRSLKIFIVASRPNPRYPDAPNMKPKAIINPVLVSSSQEKIKDWEGCLSIPDIRGFVPRHTSIKISYYTRTGIREEKEFTGFVARIFQHELDHIEGKVFLDRLETNKDIISEKEFRKLFAKEKTSQK